MEGRCCNTSKILFHERYIDDTYLRTNNKPDTLYNCLNTYYENIKLTIKINPTKFLDAEIIRIENLIKTQVYAKGRKFPVQWTSKIPMGYKSGTIIGELRIGEEKATDFN